MSTPHRCPVCEGTGYVARCESTAINCGPCHGCSGTGIVWEPGPAPVATPVLLTHCPRCHLPFHVPPGSNAMPCRGHREDTYTGWPPIGYTAPPIGTVFIGEAV